MSASKVRPTKKQRELLTYIENFIAGHGYSPSYREIKSGLGYNSVATVATHVDNLIKRGHLRKRDHSARSLEVVKDAANSSTGSELAGGHTTIQEKWLIEKIDGHFREAEVVTRPSQKVIDELYVLVGSLKVLELEGAYSAFASRLSSLKQKK